jgi:hypothetical protein
MGKLRCALPNALKMPEPEIAVAFSTLGNDGHLRMWRTRDEFIGRIDATTPIATGDCASACSK